MASVVCLGNYGSDHRALAVNGSGALSVVPTLAADAATETTLAAISAKLPAIGSQLSSASQSVTIASDEGNIPISIAADSAGLCLDATAVAMSAKLPASLGSKTSAGSLSITLASNEANIGVDLAANSIGIATESTVDAIKSAVEGTLTTTSTPQEIGSHANLWNAAATGINGDSASIDCRYCKTLTATFNTDGATDLTCYVSANDSTFYENDAVKLWAVNGDGCITFDCGMRYVRFRSSAAVTCTASLMGKQ